MDEQDKGNSEAKLESGDEYLKRLGEEYEAYRDFLPGLSDEAFQYQKKINNKRDMGVERFLADFALDAEERRRNIVRWRMGEKLPTASEERLEAIKSVLPSFVVVNKEAVGGMRVEPERKYKIDLVVEDVMTEVAKRLPRTLDAYKYHQGYAHDSIDIPEIGKIDVALWETPGVFNSISKIEGENFSIWNVRKSGVEYLDRIVDNSRPNEIIIEPLKLKIELYDDDSGIYVGKDGKEYTNARWKTRFGQGYSEDYKRDQLYRTYSGSNPSSPQPGYSNDGWDEDNTELSWNKTEDEAIVWLVDNILNPIKKTARIAEQVDVLPMEEPFPEGKVGPLFAFVKERDIEKIEVLKHGTERAYPDERSAIHPSWRFIPLDYNRHNLPEEVHDGYIWCGVGEVNEGMNTKDLTIANRERDTWGVLDTEGLVEIKPLTATDIYIADWQAWDDFREQAFKPGHDRLTDDEVDDMYQAVGKTFIPITKYEGGYKKPIVLIGRDLEVNEIGKTYIPPHERR